MVCVFWATVTNGIVRRDDVVDQDYIDFGADFPSVGLLKTSGGSVRGSGSLILEPGRATSEWVLTAAHVDITAPAIFEIGNTSYDVIEFIRHHEWEESTGGPPATGVENDIALARLAQRVPDVNPLGWHDGDDDISAGLHVVSVGLGLSGTGLTGEGGSAGTRRAAENTIDSIGSASPMTPPRTAFEYLFHAPGDPDARDMEGMAVLFDSGGPVVADYGDGFVIIGVHSYVRDIDGQGRGTYGDYVGSTRVPLYNEWIVTTIPEPSTLTLLTGVTLVFSLIRRKRVK